MLSNVQRLQVAVGDTLPLLLLAALLKRAACPLLRLATGRVALAAPRLAGGLRRLGGAARTLHTGAAAALAAWSLAAQPGCSAGGRALGLTSALALLNLLLSTGHLAADVRSLFALLAIRDGSNMGPVAILLGSSMRARGRLEVYVAVAASVAAATHFARCGHPSSAAVACAAGLTLARAAFSSALRCVRFLGRRLVVREQRRLRKPARAPRPPGLQPG